MLTMQFMGLILKAKKYHIINIYGSFTNIMLFFSLFMCYLQHLTNIGCIICKMLR